MSKSFIPPLQQEISQCNLIRTSRNVMIRNFIITIVMIFGIQIPNVVFAYLPSKLTLTADTSATLVSSPSSYQKFDLSFTGISGSTPKLAAAGITGFDPKIQRLLTFNYNLHWKFLPDSIRANRNESLQNIPIILQVEWTSGSVTQTVDAGILYECNGWREFQIDLQSNSAWFSVTTPVTLKLKFTTPAGVNVTDSASLQIRDVMLKENKYELGLDASLLMARMGIQYYDDYYRLTIQGTNPYIVTTGINASYDPEEQYVLSFDYRKGSAADFTIDYLRVFFWDYPNNPISGSDYVTSADVTVTEQWQQVTIYLKNSAYWRQGFSRLRIDFGSGSDVGNIIDVRNIRFRRDFDELNFDETKSIKDLTVSERGKGYYKFTVSSGTTPDPWVFLEPLEYSDSGYYLDTSKKVYLMFDYTATMPIQNFSIQGYYNDSRDIAPPTGTYGKQLAVCPLSATPTDDPNYVGIPWKTAAIPLTPIDYYNDGLDESDRIYNMQLHFGEGSANEGNQIQIRRIRLIRAPEVLWRAYSDNKKNNMRMPDISDIDLSGQPGNRLPLNQLSDSSASFVTRAIKKISINDSLDYEDWEKNRYLTLGGSDTLGYPAVVKNVHGASPDGRYYLYYAQHSPTSGIGCMVGTTAVDGSYIRYDRLTTSDPARKNWGNTGNSLVLEGYYNGDYVTGSSSNYSASTSDPRHLSTPNILWSSEDNLWFMYFHYFDPYPDNQSATGHQKTGLAMCADLSLNRWYILRDNSAAGNYNLPLLPAFPEATNGNQSWMTSQSSYHNILQLPSGQWVAFMRGTCSEGGAYTKIGIATSTDGINWHYTPEGDNGSGNPVISQNDGLTPVGTAARGTGNYRPHFMMYLGLLNSNEPLITSNSLYQGVWSEALSGDSNLRLISGKMTDSGSNAYLFPGSYRASTSEYLPVDAPSQAQLGTGQDGSFCMDGAFSPLRVGNNLYIFIGKDLYQINLNPLYSVPEPSFVGEPGGSCSLTEPYAVALRGAAEEEEMSSYTVNWNGKKTIIDFDFGCCEHMADYMSLNLADNGAEIYELAVFASNDKSEWQEVYKGRTYKSIGGLQGFQLEKTYARYLRVLGGGVDQENEFLPNEIRFYRRAGDK